MQDIEDTTCDATDRLIPDEGSMELAKPNLESYEAEVEFPPLSPDEAKLRNQCEQRIKDSLHDVGPELFVIKDKKLFRSTHRSFEKYCKQVFGISKVHANRKIQYHLTKELLKTEPRGSVSIPTTEAHNRPLAGLTDQETVQAAKRVKVQVGDKKPTRKDWAQAAAEVSTKEVDKPGPAKKAVPAPQLPENVAILPPPAPVSAPGTFMSPIEFHHVPELHTLKQLSDDAEKLHRIVAIVGDSVKRQEFELIRVRLARWLPLYAEWEAADFGRKPLQQEAA